MQETTPDDAMHYGLKRVRFADLMSAGRVEHSCSPAEYEAALKHAARKRVVDVRCVRCALLMAWARLP